MQDLAFRYGCPITVLNLVKEIERVREGSSPLRCSLLGGWLQCPGLFNGLN